MSKLYIRSQDREQLLLFDGSMSIIKYKEIPTPGKWKDKRTDPVEFSHAIIAGNFGRIGIYETKERCLEILDEIQKECGFHYRSTCGLNVPDMLFDMPEVYQMPEK